MFQAAISQHEQKMTDLEAERKCLMELSAAKFQKEDEFDETCSSDEEQSGEDNEGEVKDTAAGDTETVVFTGDMDDMDDIPSYIASGGNRLFDEGYTSEEAFSSTFGGEDADTQELFLSGMDSQTLSSGDSDETIVTDVGQIVLSDGFSASIEEPEAREFCTRETLHNVLSGLNTVMMELAYLGGQERDIVPRSADLALAVLDGVFASAWSDLRWGELSEANAVLLAEFFSHSGDTYGGYNRVQLEKLKQLPIYINIRNMACAIHGSQDFFLIPPNLNLTDIPVPPSAQQRFLKSNPRLNIFYKDLGVDEMSDSKLLLFAIPMYKELQESQRDQLLDILLRKWQSLRGNAELIALLRTAPLFREEEDEIRSYHQAIGSTLVKGSSVFFHLGENLAPLMFEVPRVFGAYDTLFRRMGSKDSPDVSDYLRLLRDLNDECRGQALNLNELIAATRAVELLAGALTETNHRLSLQEKKHIFLPSGIAVMQSMLVMAYNDSAALCASIDLTELHMVHPRISTRCCQVLGVPGITSVVTEELEGTASLTTLVPSSEVAHFNGIMASQQFADGLRKIIIVQQQKQMSYEPFGFRPDFEDLNQRIVNLATFEVKCVAELHTRFIASVGFPARKLDVTKSARQDSLYFLDQTRKEIYIANRTLKARSGTVMRATQLVARCINQLLGGVLQDGSVLESLLSCDESEIPEVLQLLDIYEDPVLIVEKLRGHLGEPLSEADSASVELAPLRSCLPGELVAVADENGVLCYGKILREKPSNVAGMSHYEVKVSNLSSRWMLATQLYFFRSARVGTGGSSSSKRGNIERSVTSADTAQSDTVSLPVSVVALPSESESSEETTRTMALAPAVSTANVLSAVNDLLSRLNVSLDTSVEDLMAKNLQLQRRLELAEDGRRAAAEQIDTVLREKKDVQDSLVCAVCLENKVDRVLIPCGHIYCGVCVEQLPRPSCPICRQRIHSSSAFHVPS
ncbi:hypothetical protein PHYBOEH_010851 [Phytophthora boehmeriae]|uniref:RING-type domain-containing protein n=1 Tax=Phytophthora boehmeriae TaxID=109152 RepID=A0A8T1WXJ4_9STRA|nr:hypothetical protein PHYBOEH_010851 [Phytophthora boehmeriae]